MNSPADTTSDPLLEGLFGDFLDESTELLKSLSAGLFRLDDLLKSSAADPTTQCLTASSCAANAELLNDMFRAAHSLKGLSGMMRLNHVNGLTHLVENIFDAARGGLLPIKTATVDLLFRSVDRLEVMIDALREGRSDDVDYRDIQEAIEQLLALNSKAARTGSVVASRAESQVENISSLIEAAVGDAVADSAAGNEEAAAAIRDLEAIVDDRDIPPKYVAIFIDESERTLDEFSEALMAGADVADKEVLLTTCHRLKGSAASIGLQRIARLSHLMEDLLQDLCTRPSPLNPEIADALLSCVDALRLYVSGLKSGTIQDELAKACQSLLQVAKPADLAASACVATGEKKDAIERLKQARQAAVPGTSGLVGVVRFEADLPLAELKAALALEKLQRLGQVFFCHPPEDSLDQASSIERLVFGVATESTIEAIQAELQMQGVVGVELEYFSDATNAGVAVEQVSQTPAATAPIENRKESPSTKAGEGSAKTKSNETLRVDIERLDQLMSLAGQLVINKARFTQIGARLKETTGFKSIAGRVGGVYENARRLATICQGMAAVEEDREAGELRALAYGLCAELELLRKEVGDIAKVRSTIGEFNEAIHQLNRVTDGIQSTVMDTRMVPIGPLFTRFRRVVRDLSRDNHKQIELQINGEGTELDKRMIDELGDPLIHLIRNSADHGIELPEDRIKAGKPPHGVISLNAFHRGNRIVIQITDDGRGLDADRIRAKALSKGLIAESEAERMTPEELYRLIWKPGFSTAERITEVSGRGMGMDIVQSKIEQLNGVIDAASERGVGTRFEIKLPLTMAIVPSLLTEMGNEVFAIPVESILEIVQMPTSSLRTVQGRLTARVRDRIISVVELHELFAWSEAQAGGISQSSSATLVVVGSDRQEFALAVDRLVGEQDVVIKSLEENFQNISGLAGASILGNGRISLILDVQAMISMIQTARVSGGQELVAEAAEAISA